jgi:hypothetical protein
MFFRVKPAGTYRYLQIAQRRFISFQGVFVANELQLVGVKL